MPPLQQGGQSLTRLVSSIGFRIYHGIEEFLWAFMIVATALVVIRTLIVIWLAYGFRRGPKADFAEPISVVMAAYNEGKVIAETLRALLGTDYKGEIEVIVVNDGSRDETTAEVERVAHVDPRVRLLQQENRGKRAPCKRGLRRPSWHRRFHRCRCQCQHDTLRGCSNLLPMSASAPFRVTRSWKLAHIHRGVRLWNTPAVSISIDAYNRWNCVTVVPGAISAIRRDAIDEAGGLSLQTLAEDTDLTLSLHKHRQRIVYMPDAIAWTEAPESVRARAATFRWPTARCSIFGNIATWCSAGTIARSAGSVCRASGFRSSSSPSRQWWICFARLAAIRRMAGGHAIRHHILVDGRDPRDARLHSGARTNSARVAHLADALNLSADAQLLHLESDLARGERRLGGLGQTRAHRERAGPRVIVDLRVNEAFETLEQRRAACAAGDTVRYSNPSDDRALCVSQKSAGTSIYRSKRPG
jgi:cellulose synthase/poly-beta-1,6-N-acetylglucosamine synthase-like glycosyltransferase